MRQPNSYFIRIRDARENNLDIEYLEIPHRKLIVVTGVSGSGKSSLAFDLIAKEGQRRYLETFSSFSRNFMSKWSRPKVGEILGLGPVITLSQRTSGSSGRSTVGTLSDLYDHLRLLFARLGAPSLSRSHFSFNSPKGACPVCKGLGQEEKISLKKLVAHPERSLREGALAPSLPNGYIMYSQVTLDVLNTVCEAHGFNIDIPWQELKPEDQQVILYGSERIKVPFGKHSLESRLKWTGIAAKPREEGYYKGMVPIMSDILRRDRNKNILRYAETYPCSSCGGARLNTQSRSVKLKDVSISELCAMELEELLTWLEAQKWTEKESRVALPVIEKMKAQIEMLSRLGVGYLQVSRNANSLTGGEVQRIRLVNQVTAELSEVIYVFDEPSIGLHPRDNAEMIRILRRLVQLGNTVIVVEHDEATLRAADWVVDIGPGAGVEGGTLLFNGWKDKFFSRKDLLESSPTRRSLSDKSFLAPPSAETREKEFIGLQGCHLHNLQNINVHFQKAAFNVVTGVAGAGKSSLIHGSLEPALRHQLGIEELEGLPLESVSGMESIDKLVTIDQKPIGRTPRSNPATYTGLADKIRDLFAKVPEAKELGFKKSRFSFNTKGGRCETCEGAGRIQVGMHLLGSVDIVCGTCQGKRFNEETLQIRFRDRNIFEVFEMRIDAAVSFFEGEAKVLHQLRTLQSVGLGYLTLGQPSTTLSGGEAQRIKLAKELQQKQTGNTLYLLDEPTIGLHREDVEVLLKALRALIEAGNTLICIEHDAQVIRQADWVVDLGPESGKKGGQLVYEGPVAGLLKHPDSLTALHWSDTTPAPSPTPNKRKGLTDIILRGVRTHFLDIPEVHIPRHQFTVLTGVSGSGKSSLAFDTLFSESQSRFSESLSTYTRTLLRQSNTAEVDSVEGLSPVVAIGRKFLSHSPRSTVGTRSGVDENLRLLYSRVAQAIGLELSARDFSFNHQAGACPDCDGIGLQLVGDPEQLVTNPEKSVLEGAFDGSKTGKSYGDPHGKFMAILKTVAQARQVNLTLPWNELSGEVRDLILNGTGAETYQVTWEFKNRTRSGVQEFTAPWEGFSNYLTEEYRRKAHNKNIASLRSLLKEAVCPSCQGDRIRGELNEVKLNGLSISDLRRFSMRELQQWHLGDFNFSQYPFLDELLSAIGSVSRNVVDLGLMHLSLDRRTDSLSGGEAQRLRLASALNGNLSGVTYILDEPTIGLGEAHTNSLIIKLNQLKEKGNTLVVVEHDEQMIRAADHLIELGPGPGKMGGKLIASGSPAELVEHPDSLTGKYLKQALRLSPPVVPAKGKPFGIEGARAHNLKNIKVSFQAGQLIALTGPSGSGKSSLLRDVLLPSVKSGKPVHCDRIFGFGQFKKVLLADQLPLSGNSMSSVATYLGLMDHLRSHYANTEAAREAGLKKAAFSYLNKGGMCPTCKGSGQQKTALDFVGDLFSPCDTCKGSRYSPLIESVQRDGISISGALQMTVDEASAHFSDLGKIAGFLEQIKEVGLGHVQLGQATRTLSGGEAQRLKLCRELLSSNQDACLFLFDEPGNGLHFQDLERLHLLFTRLLSDGHTVLFIEHHPGLIAGAHQGIELGPEGGEKGGEIVRKWGE